jgi:threonine/homoserine/homoserine lactone efflux protein
VASEPAFAAVKLAGAAYLIFLGGQAVWAALRSNGSEPSASGYTSAQRLGAGAAFRQGVLSNLANPKMAVFFTSLLPQFTPRSDTTFTALLVLGLLFCSMTLGWLSAYAMALAKAGDVLRRPRIRRALEGLTGAVLIGLGLRLAFERR